MQAAGMEKRAGRERERDVVVFPWSGIVTNIPGSDPLIATAQVQEYFSEFEPLSVHVFREVSNTAWFTGVLQFNADMEGYMNAAAFQRYFQEIGKGRRAWEAQCSSVATVSSSDEKAADLVLFGWMATQDDLNLDNQLGIFLSQHGALRTVPEVVKELRQMQSVSTVHAETVQQETASAAGREQEAQAGQGKDLEALIMSLATKVDGISRALKSRSSLDEDLHVATEVLRQHGPSPGMVFKECNQEGHSTVETDTRLARLKQDWGHEVFQKFMTVIGLEGSHDGCSVAWNVAEDRRATLTEVVKGLEDVIETKNAVIRRKSEELERKHLFIEHERLDEVQRNSTSLQTADRKDQGNGEHVERTMEELERKNHVIEMAKRELERKSALLDAVKEQLSESIDLIRITKEELQRKNCVIEAQKEALQLKNEALESTRQEITRKDHLIVAKDMLIEARRNAIEKKDYLNKTLLVELKLKNHLLEVKREEVKRKDVFIREKGMDVDYQVEVMEFSEPQDDPNEVVQVLDGLTQTPERRYPKRMRN